MEDLFQFLKFRLDLIYHVYRVFQILLLTRLLYFESDLLQTHRTHILKDGNFLFAGLCDGVPCNNPVVR